MRRTVQAPLGPAGHARRERTGLFVLAGFIVTAIGLYLALGAASGGRGGEQALLPYQALARTLPEADQRQFRALREGLLAAEAERARTSRWPDVAALGTRGGAPFAPAGADQTAAYRWERLQEGATVNYLGSPADPSRPAWLLAVQEPEPGTLPDTAPNDDEHHRLPDQTVLHIYVWMHQYGGQVPVAFVPQPQNAGWIQIFSAPPNPVPAAGR